MLAWMLSYPSRAGRTNSSHCDGPRCRPNMTPSPAASPVRCHQRLWTSAAHPACISLPRASHSFINLLSLPNDSCRIAWATSETHRSRVYGCSTEQYRLAMAPNSEVPFTATTKQWFAFHLPRVRASFPPAPSAHVGQPACGRRYLLEQAMRATTRSTHHSHPPRGPRSYTADHQTTSTHSARPACTP
jgi:hypothetical protein